METHESTIANGSRPEERLALALDCAQTGVFDWDLDSGEVYLNPVYYTMLGYEPGDFPPTPDSWRSLVHPGDLPVLTQVVSEYYSLGRREHSLRYRMLAKDGEWVWVRSKGRLAGSPRRRLIGTHVDISDQCRREAELTELRDRLDERVSAVESRLLRTALDLTRSLGEQTRTQESLQLLERAVQRAQVAIFITDAGGHIKFANEHFSRLTGWSAEECLGRRPSLLKSGNHTSDFYRGLWKTVLSGHDWRGTFCNRRKDGSLYWAESVISPVLDDQSAVTHIVAVQMDVTRDMESERERNALLESFHQRERLASVGRMAAGAAHSLRNILTSVDGGITLLGRVLEEGNLVDARAAFRLLSRGARRLELLVEELLGHVKEPTPILEEQPVGDFLQQVGELVHFAFDKRSLQFEIQLPREDVSWRFDRILIERAVVNLLINAIDAMPDGGKLRLEATLVAPPELPTGRTYVGPIKHCEKALVLGVHDTGTGIPPEILEKVFSPNFSTKGSRGTGLGLVNVAETVAAHSGEIRLRSEVGKGTSIFLMLP